MYASKQKLYQLAATVIFVAAVFMLMTPVAGLSAGKYLAPGSRAPGQTVRPATGNARPTPVKYYNWSGYAVTGQTFTKVQGAVKVPKVTCTVNSAQTVFWVGLDGFQNSTVEQAGVGVACGGANKRTPSYYAWWEMYPTNLIQTMPLKVVPGNLVTSTVSYANSKFTLKVANDSRNTSYTKTATCAKNQACSRSSAEWVAERPGVSGTYTALAKWNGNVSLYNDTAAAGGSLKPVSGFSYIPINMINTGNKSLATASSLSANGKSFTDTWKAAK